MEVALGHDAEDTGNEISRSFNPCFRGSRPRTEDLPHRSAICPRVSILVFVEVALGQMLTVYF